MVLQALLQLNYYQTTKGLWLYIETTVSQDSWWHWKRLFPDNWGARRLRRFMPACLSCVILRVISVKEVFCKWVVGIEMARKQGTQILCWGKLEKTLLFSSLSQLSCRNYEKQKHGLRFSWLLQESPILRGKLPAGVICLKQLCWLTPTEALAIPIF